MNFRAQKLIQQDVAAGLVSGVLPAHPATQYQVAGKTRCRAGGGRLPGMIGLHGAEGHNDIRAGPGSLCEQIFQFPGLVAAGCQTRAVVTFEPDTRAPQLGSEALQQHKGSRQIAQLNPGNVEDPGVVHGDH